MKTFETWYLAYAEEACREYGGMDCSNPQGIAEAAWDAATEQSQARIASLEAENARLKNDRVNGYTVESGGVNYAVIRNALSKISGMPAMAYATMEHIDHIAATIAQQAEKLAATEKDAERYRWLRQQQIDLKAPALGVLNHGVFIGKVPDNVVLSEADADAAIDEAREGK